MTRFTAAVGLLAAGTILTAGCANDAPTRPDQGAPPTIQAAIDPGPYTPGQSYFGRNNYIEYIAGNAPVILSAPHGGDLEPSEIPDRNGGSCGGSATTSRDLNTRELTLAMRQAFFDRFGTYPHVIINHLRRTKLDANRDIVEGACGDPEAEEAWNEFQDFIDVAKAEVLQAHGKGWYMDMHGHGHEIQRLELGYLLTGSQLRQSDATLDGDPVWEDTASVQTMSVYNTGTTLSQLLRSASSLGELYADNGFPSVPSLSDPYPESGESYFSGGYNTRRHGCGVEAGPTGGTPGGNICGVQIEANYTGVRDNSSNREAFATATAIALEQYLLDHWDIDLGGGGTPGGGITLQATGYKVKGVKHADLTWSGAMSANVDVYRDGVVVATTANDGAHTDNTGEKGGAPYTYKVCEAGTSVCSNEVDVTY